MDTNITDKMNEYELTFASRTNGTEETILEYEDCEGVKLNDKEMYDLIMTNLEHLDESDKFGILMEDEACYGSWKLYEIISNGDDEEGYRIAGEISSEDVLDMYIGKLEERDIKEIVNALRERDMIDTYCRIDPEAEIYIIEDEIGDQTRSLKDHTYDEITDEFWKWYTTEDYENYYPVNRSDDPRAIHIEIRLSTQYSDDDIYLDDWTFEPEEEEE